MKKNQRPERRNHRTTDHPRPAGGRSTWWIGGALFLVAGVAGYFAVTWFLRPTLPDEIVGEWQIEEGELRGTRVSFARDGTFQTSLTIEGRNVEVKAVVRKEGDTLRYTVTFPDTGKEMTRLQTIKKLTDREMIVEENRQQSRLVRIDSPE